MKNAAAVALGSMTSEKKAKACRENGKLGGRPRVRPPPPPGFMVHPKWDMLAANADGCIMRLDFRCREPLWRTVKPCVTSSGYLQLSPMNGVRVSGHRIVYECLHRQVYNWSVLSSEGLTIDHINGVKTDNRIENLQILTSRQNSRKSNCTIELPRYLCKARNSYRIQICVNGKTVSSKSYRTMGEAVLARSDFLSKHGRVFIGDDIRPTCAGTVGR